jgi:hypothetical protein
MLPVALRDALNEDSPLVSRPEFDLATLSTFVQSTIRATGVGADSWVD